MELVFLIVCFFLGISLCLIYLSKYRRKKLEEKILELNEEIELLSSKNIFMIGECNYLKKIIDDFIAKQIAIQKKEFGLNEELKKVTMEKNQAEQKIHILEIQILEYKNESKFFIYKYLLKIYCEKKEKNKLNW